MSKADRKWLADTFCRLVAIDSESGCEREMADALTAELEKLGFEVTEDRAGETFGGNAGNLFAVLKGDPDVEPVLFSGHMDTVKPGIGKEAIIDENGRITSSGKTVLGSDDLSGVVEILEGVRLARESGKKTGDIEILFTAAEEAYGLGANAFDYGKIRSKQAFVLDLTGAPGIAAIKAPSIVSFEAAIKGKPAHAGFEPEKGINAGIAAVRAVSQIRQGHVGDMTVNVGQISGGVATNIVMEDCVVKGEVRGFDHEAVLDEVLRIGNIFLLEGDAVGASVKFSHKVCIKAFDIPAGREVSRRFVKACGELGLECSLIATHGGSDNAVYVDKGIDGIVLSCGMYDVHSVKEYSFVDDLVSGAELVEALILGMAEEA
ncbi:MAG: M20/M25/M40 family metallo-hydrolase [Firmicutes bacterium]|nr:M20/M25/M40 family metallo-hydrolase [Bacillota bacterium]